MLKGAAVIIVTYFLLLCPLASAQATRPATQPSPGQQWRADSSAGIKALDAGRLDDADRAFNAALNDAAGFAPLDARRALTICNLGVVLSRRHRTQEALAHYEQALKVYDQSLPGNDFRKAIALDNIADAQTALGKLAEAERARERSLNMYMAMMSPHDPRLIIPLQRLGDVRSLRQEYDQAQPLFRKAIDIATQNKQQQTITYAILLDELAVTYLREKEFKEAEPLLEQAKPIAESNADKYPLTQMRTLGLLGELYEYEGRYTDAQAALQRAIDVDRKSFPKDPFVARLMSMQAVAVAGQGDYEQAESLYKQAIQIREALHLPRDPELLSALSGYANILRQMGRLDDAKAVEQRAVELTAGKPTTRPATLPATMPSD